MLRVQATWSFVKLEYYPEALLDAVTRALTQQSAAYDGKALSNVLWALARHGPLPATPAMLKAVAAELGPRAKVRLSFIRVWCLSVFHPADRVTGCCPVRVRDPNPVVPAVAG